MDSNVKTYSQFREYLDEKTLVLYVEINFMQVVIDILIVKLSFLLNLAQKFCY